MRAQFPGYTHNHKGAILSRFSIRRGFVYGFKIGRKFRFSLAGGDNSKDVFNSA